MDFQLFPAEFHPYVVIGVLILIFTSIYTGIFTPTVSFLLGTMILIITGMISPADILIGFSNQSIASVIMLILITAGLQNNFNTSSLLDRIFGKINSYKTFLAVLLTKVAVLSSVVNNTPVVVLMTPYVFEWGKKRNISPSKLLIPLSYATICGGMITIIGTSTTLVLNGFLIDTGQVQLKSTDLLFTGLTVTIICLLFLILFSNRILPDRMDIIEKFHRNRREYLIEKRLRKGSPLVNKTIVDGGLRELNGVYLVEIVRDDEVITPVNPQEIIQQNDILIFAGSTENIIDVTLTDLGIRLPDELTPTSGHIHQVVEGVISSNSSLVNKTVKDAQFRDRYDAAVVAIHRHGEQLRGKIGNIKLMAGDVLLMYTGQDFRNRIDLYKDIIVITGEEMQQGPPYRSKVRVAIVAITALIMLFTQAFNLFTSLLIIFSMLVAFQIITIKNMKRDLDAGLVAMLVLSITIGEAMIKTGTGDFLADNTLSFLQYYGPVWVLVGLMILTTILTSFVTNIGAVAIAFPIALALSESMGMEGAPFFLGITFAASAAFLTPIGYQTNLIVYGPGGYSFGDFIRIGIPMTIIYLFCASSMILYLYRDIFFG
jgi:di/tricarboxylate transporter